MERIGGNPERPDDYNVKLCHFRQIKKSDSLRFAQAVTWTQLMINDPQHPDRLRLFPDWTEDDLRSLLKDALAY